MRSTIADEFILVAQNTDTNVTKYYVARPLIPTHTSITSNINPSTYGQQIHLVAKVTPDSRTGSDYRQCLVVRQRCSALALPDDDHRNFELGAVNLDGWCPQRDSGIPRFHDVGFEHVARV